MIDDPLAKAQQRPLPLNKWKPYPAYKDSGVGWLGEVPANWEVKRLKYIADFPRIKLAEKPDDLPYLGLEHIESKTGRLNLEAPIDQVDSIGAVFKKEDVLFGKLRPYLAKVYLADLDGVCTTEFLVLRSSSQLMPKLLFYQLLSEGFIDLVNSMTYGAKMPRASHQQISNLLGLIPHDTVNPVNYEPLDSSPKALQQDVEHALAVGNLYLDTLPGGAAFLPGKKVLEVGPGINLGPILMLACHGAQVAVADRFLTSWDTEYHPQFYRLLKDKLIKRWPSIDLKPLEMILSRKTYPPECIALYSSSLEKLLGIPDQCFDLVVSYDVLEHLYDLESAFSQLARITKPGGLGIHQVDFRDHRDFSRPLDYLLLSDKEFIRQFKERLGECGNRYRPQEMQQLLESKGFAILTFQPTGFIEEQYVTDFLPHLKKSRRSRYRSMTTDDLQVIQGYFILEKKTQASFYEGAESSWR